MTGSDEASRKAKRTYSEKTLKILFTMSHNQCAHPRCPTPIIAPKTRYSGAIVIGQIAHIYALSEDGPRGKSGLSEKEKNSPDNLILLCPTHHVMVDGQHETYPANVLFEWKELHEQQFKDDLGGKIGDIGFVELEAAANALMSATIPAQTTGLTQIPTEEKIDKNGLGATSKMLLTMGAAKSADVENVLVKAAQLDSDFPDRLREGFVSQYTKLVDEGLDGDDLFLGVYEWAAGGTNNKNREAAGLCILSHLFIICDVFKK